MPGDTLDTEGLLGAGGPPAVVRGPGRPWMGCGGDNGGSDEASRPGANATDGPGSAVCLVCLIGEAGATRKVDMGDASDGGS